MKIVLLHDQVTEASDKDTADVLAQVESITTALTSLGHELLTMPFSLNLKMVSETLLSLHPDCVFNLVESTEGQGRLIYLAPALLDTLDLPYTGAKTEAMFLTTSKLLTKNILRSAGVATPAWLSLANKQDIKTLAAGRYIIKPVWEDASKDIDEESVMDFENGEQLYQKIQSCQKQSGGDWFAETYIEGRELNLSMLADDNGPEVLPPAEIMFENYPPEKPKVVGYRAKWEEDSFEYRHTPRRFDFPLEDQPLLAALTNIAKQCWHLFGLRGYDRVDFRVDENGKPWVLEVNINPCLSPDAGFVAAATQRGLNFQQIVTRILHDSNCENF